MPSMSKTAPLTARADPANPYFLVGARVALRALQESDVRQGYLSWLNDEKVCEGNGHHLFPYTEAEALDYVRRAQDMRQHLILAMVDRASGRHIGNIALQNISPLHQSAEFSILLGDRGFWNKGYGKEAGLLLMRHGFRSLNLQRIGCGTFGSNKGMRKLALALGMKPEGIRKRAFFKNGIFEDVHLFGALRRK